MKKILFALLAVVVAVAIFVTRKSNHEERPVDAPEARQEAMAPGLLPPVKTESKAVPTPGIPAFAEKTWSTIPTLADLQKIPKEELHGTPKAVKAAALALGDLAQSIADHPELKQDGYLFYEKCAGEKTFPMSVRATCLKNYRKLGADLRLRVDETALPPGLRMLANKLED